MIILNLSGKRGVRKKKEGDIFFNRNDNPEAKP